jgi:hypothetical protein
MRVLAEVIDAEIAPYSRLDRTLVRVNRPQRR